MSKFGFTTTNLHADRAGQPEHGVLHKPIHTSVAYGYEDARHLAEVFQGKRGGYTYGRQVNPTVDALQTRVNLMEGGFATVAFATGMAATTCVVQSLRSGDHVLAGADIYGGTYRLLHQVADRWGVSVTLADSTDLAAFERAMRPETKLVWVESPGNPRMTVTDYAAVADMAHRHGARMGCDNTFATPVLTRPLELGADVVMHSATKYYGGHSDLMGGLLATRDPAFYDELAFLQNATGGVMGPLEAFLCSRGIKTLPLRVLEQSKTALALAEWLDGRPEVARVNYPGLPGHPGHELAQRQMRGGYGAMTSFELEAGFEAAKRLVESTRLFQLAVSLGAVESLIEQPASMSHASYAAEDRAKHGITDGMIRLSVGLEDVDDLRADLEQALAAV